MTSTYDNLGSLIYEFQNNNRKIGDLLSRLFEYTIAEISETNPKVLNWKDFIQHPFYSKLNQLEQIEYFFSHAHSKLDHTEQYHFKTISRELDLLIGKIHEWFVTFKDRKDGYDRYYGLADFDAKMVRKYPKVFKELKVLIDTKVIDIEWLSKREKTKVERWSKYI